MDRGQVSHILPVLAASRTVPKSTGTSSRATASSHSHMALALFSANKAGFQVRHEIRCKESASSSLRVTLLTGPGTGVFRRAAPGEVTRRGFRLGDAPTRIGCRVVAGQPFAKFGAGCDSNLGWFVARGYVPLDRGLRVETNAESPAGFCGFVCEASRSLQGRFESALPTRKWRFGLVPCGC